LFRIGYTIAALALVLLLYAIAAPAEGAADFSPALIYGIKADRHDNSYYESVTRGARRFSARLGIGYASYFVTRDSGWKAPLRAAVREGHDPVVAVGPFFGPPVDAVAAEFPHTRFSVVDSVAARPNVRSVTFREQEGSFLVGVLAAMASTSGVVGYVGGMDVPAIRRFECGFRQGVGYVNANTRVLSVVAGDTPQAWVSPEHGAALARQLMDRGADVIYQAAGVTGLGVIRAVADADRLAIGVDTNQNGLRPGHVLTSMLKRVDVAVYHEFRDAQRGQWHAGHVSLGLAENGVAWAFDQDNAMLISEAMYRRVTRAERAIVAGRLRVGDGAGGCAANAATPVGTVTGHQGNAE
jgi:basic membrane protein A